MSDRVPEERERIVVIDDDYVMRLSCRQILTKSGFEVETYEDGAQGLAGVAETKPAIVVVDLKMPGISGLEVISRVRQIDPAIVLIVITGYATVSTAVEAMKSGAYDFLPKPFKPDELRLIVDRALERRRLQRRSRELEMEREFMKRRFVSFVSHQLKTPLSAIHQYLEVLSRLGEDPAVAEQRDEWLRRCLVRTQGMRELIDDWLTLARAEGPGLVAEREPLDTGPILEALVESNAEWAEAGGIDLSVELPAGAEGLAVAGDRNCLTVLFDNLINNAIAYTGAGGEVRVRGRLDPGEVVVEVEDSGVGIPAESVERLFEEFYRVNGASSPGRNGAQDAGPGRSRGTGLGLPICKRIVSELGGRIEVESEEGEGSTFRVRLPAYRERVEPGADAEH